MKKLIPALAMLLIAAVMLGTSTYAWFSMNRTVTATGMKVKAQAAGSIVITSTAALPADGTKTTDYNFADGSATALNASTHSTDYVTHTTGLKYVTNPELINLETGVRLNNDAVLTYGDAVNGSYVYYKDYSVFIAGDGDVFEHQDITVSLLGTTAGGNINKAISVDFYAETKSTTGGAAVSSANYKGTLNVAGVKNVVAENANEAYASFVISDITIPKTGSGSAYAITMRVYYDGALIEQGGTNAYTTYEAATGTDGKCDADKYYYTSNTGSGVATVTAGTTPVTGLYQVKEADSTYAYARTTEIANIADVSLTVSFVASNHS